MSFVQDIQEIVRNFNPPTGQVRMFGMVLTIVLVLFGFFAEVALLYLIAIPVLLIALVMPDLFRPLLKVLIALTAPIGWVLSRVILTLVFFLVITPLGLIVRLFADPLSLSVKGDSYWKDVEENKNPDSLSL